MKIISLRMFLVDSSKMVFQVTDLVVTRSAKRSIGIYSWLKNS
jgi:hypothetical protein